MAKQKRVFSTIGETCHEWAHNWRSLGNGRNSTGNIYFQQDTIYSYGGHFPIARMTETADGETVVLFNPDSYSTSTGRHQSNVRGAVSHLTSFDVPNLEPRNNADHVENWTALRSALNSCRNRLHNDRNPEVHQIAWCDNAAKRCNDYARAFKVKLADNLDNLQAFTEEQRAVYMYKIDTAKEEREIRAARASEKAAIAATAKLEAEAIRDAEQARLELFERLSLGLYKAPRPSWKYGYSHRPQRNAKPSRDERAELKAKLSAWKRGEGRMPHSYDGPTLMRLDGDNVRTSKNAVFPVADCKAIWPSIEAARDTAIRSENPEFKLGSFPVNHISESGDVKASCHFISYAECRKLAIILGLIEPTMTERLAYKARKLGLAIA